MLHPKQPEHTQPISTSCQLSKLNKLSHQLVAQQQLGKKQQDKTGASHSTQHMPIYAFLRQEAAVQQRTCTHTTSHKQQPYTTIHSVEYTTSHEQQPTSCRNPARRPVSVAAVCLWSKRTQQAKSHHSTAELSPVTSFSCVAAWCHVGHAHRAPQCLSTEWQSTFHGSPQRSTAAQLHKVQSCPPSRTIGHLGTGNRAPAAAPAIRAEHESSGPTI